MFFALVQGLFADGFRRVRINDPHGCYLVGKVFCAHCGCRLTPKSANHPGRKKSYTAYYECYRLSKYRGFPCEVRRMNADQKEKLTDAILKRATVSLTKA
jgi:uncharacterized Zn finger protein (UPF0148 family)